MTYPFRQGIDYGQRTKGTRGLALHMTEGSGGVGDVTYLMRHAGETVAEWHTRIRGVSAHVVITADGAVYQMVDFDHAAGSFDPGAPPRGEAGYWKGSIYRSILGTAANDPNAATIVAEIAGKRAAGPTPAQVTAAIEWGLDMINRYPTIAGTFGHADQTATKDCPGTTIGMRHIFEALGGHGLRETPVHYATVTDETAALVTTAQGTTWYDLDGYTAVHANADALAIPRVSPFACGTFRAIYATVSGVRRLVLVKPATLSSGADALAIERERIKSAAVTATAIAIGGIK